MENEEIKHRVESLEKSNDLILETIIKDQKESALALDSHIESFKEYHRKLEEGAQSRRDFVKTLDLFYDAVQKVVDHNETHHQARDYFKNVTDEFKQHLDESKEFIKIQTDKIPNSFQVKHHVAPSSLGILAIMVTLVLTSVFALGWGIASYHEKESLKANNVKYRMFRHEFPPLVQSIDSLYYENPEKAELVISKLEEEAELRKAAERKRLEAESIAGEKEIVD
ncbi:hypothetical protein [Albibacterium bauzanense]|uniref:Uncharacterized protein n=1 Tax=Albibacterium bauzanense TaxID=653929 RepID=A0A4R1LWJ9_9SPHI|nr:hypothetical protein [Albibacterium bauzanense]TCK82900.1 hypothetical protein C8N28_1486 [Albibacterium bauzanense]